MSIAHTNVVAKIAAVAAGLALVLSSVAVAVPARAATTAELEAQVAALLAQLQAMQGGTTTGAAFTMDMTIGASGAEVTRLQNWLISKGYSIPAGATGYFGAQTAAAVAAYQTASGITPAAGYFGPMTRAKVNATLTTTDDSDDSDDDSDNDSGDLEGGAGEISDADFITSLNNEDVGEDEEDSEVAGLEIEAGDDSDIELTSVRLVFNEGGSQPAGSDFEDYASEVSVWFDGEELARVDGSDFDEDNNWTRSISLDDGAIIRAGEVGELTVAISGVSNLDSADAGDTWTVEFDNVRFMDGDGATVTEDDMGDIGGATRTITFTTFAASADISLDLSLTDGDDADDINDARVIDTDDTDETENVEVLAFSLELEGDSEVTIDDLTFTIATSTMTLDNMVSEFRLMHDGEEIGSESVGSDPANSITFDDLELVLDSEDTYDFTVEVDLLENITNGSTLSVSMTEAQLEAADIEDESGEDLGNSDISGSATGEAHGLYQAGIMVEFVSADADVSYTGDVANTNDHDRGTFVITFDVTAFDTDVYVDHSAITVEDGNTLSEQDVSLTGSPTITGVVDTTTGATRGTDGFLVEEDETERFTVTVNATPAADGFVSMTLDGVLYALTDVDGTTEYTFDMSDYKTDQIFLNYDA